MLAWISHLGWFQPEQSSGGGDAVSFNWHPLLMTLAFPLAMTEGMMAYKLEHDHGVSHGTSKRVHGSLQGASLLFAAIGVALVFVNHEQKGIPHLYSAHSWLGIATLTLLIVQAGIAALLFGTPSFFSEDTRHIALPFHRCACFAAPALPPPCLLPNSPAWPEQAGSLAMRHTSRRSQRWRWGLRRSSSSLHAKAAPTAPRSFLPVCAS